MIRPSPRVLLPLLALLLTLLPAIARADILDDYWYLVEIQGKKCGHMHAWTVKDGNQFTTHSEIRMTVKRGESIMPVTLASQFTETADAKPIKMRSERKLGSLPTIEEYTFKSGGVEVVRSVADSKQVTTEPLPDGDWLTPVALGKYIESHIAAGDKEIITRSLEPTEGLKPSRQTMKLVDKAPLEVTGKTVPALKWSSTNDSGPGLVSTEYTDEKGISLRTDSDMGGLKVTFLRADKALALAKADPPEVLESTLIRPDKAIKSPRDCQTGNYTISCGDAPIGDWPSAGIQTVTKVDDHTIKVHVEAKHTSVVPADEAQKPEFHKPSSMINSEDAEVVKLKIRALTGHEKEPPAARAELLRQFVYHFISKKSFDVGFASAAETARTQTGDCTEHAVLLCALLRADNIPARCTSGLVYIEGAGSTSGGTAKGFFGYHMWTQAMLPGEGPDAPLNWTDLDATLSPTIPMDATHLAIKPTALADGETVNALMDILPTLGKLKVHVDHVEPSTKH